jgi:hypothetical protein
MGESIGGDGDAYEPFHLTGDPGILEEVDDYVRGALA